MNVRTAVFLSAALFPFSMTFAAGSIQVRGFDADGNIHEYMPASSVVFGDRIEKVSVVIEGSAAEPAAMRADLLQVVESLSMPIAKDLHALDGITFPNRIKQVLQGSIKIPEVKKRTEMLIRLTLVPNGAPAIYLAEINLVVFPASVTKELTDLLHMKPDGAAQVVVFGPGQKLRQFFTKVHVVFEDGGQETPDRFDSSRYYFGELNSDDQLHEAQDRRAGARMALFSLDGTVPPGIYSDRSNTGTLINVSLPMLDNLADDPMAQFALIKIIQLLSANPTSAN